MRGFATHDFAALVENRLRTDFGYIATETSPDATDDAVMVFQIWVPLASPVPLRAAWESM